MKKFYLIFLAAVIMVVFGGYSAECGTTTYSFSDLNGEWMLTTGTGPIIGKYAGQSFIGSAAARSGSVNVSNIKDFGNGTADCNIKMTSSWNLSIYTSSDSHVTEFSFNADESQTITQNDPETFTYNYAYQSADADETGTVKIILTSDTTGKVIQLGTIDNGSGTEINYELTFYLTRKGSNSDSGGGGGGCNAGYGYIMLAALGIIPIILKKK